MERFVNISGASGLAGNIWQGLMIGLGAAPRIAEDLPTRLSLPFVTVAFHVSQRDGLRIVRSTITGTDAAPPTTWASMLRTVERLDGPTAVKSHALQVLRARQGAESSALGVALEERVYSGDAAADTLIDVVGGTWLWWSLGCPLVHVDGSLSVGRNPPSAVTTLLRASGIDFDLLAAAPELTTPTGAALLAHAWTPDAPPGEVAARAEAPATFSDQGLAPPAHAELIQADRKLHRRRVLPADELIAAR